ncbi:hypothetical protein EJ110_NYTH01254 [Nymphaea thermarum]|nr:hypothetical protein EJ110_NYTH01254 [Nymphaea thermarum]
MASPSSSSSSSSGSSVGPKTMKVAGGSSSSASVSPKEGGGGAGSGMCLCSPTTHQGSFRCKYHRASPSPTWMKRSNSMPANKSVLSPKSVESIHECLVS